MSTSDQISQISDRQTFDIEKSQKNVIKLLDKCPPKYQKYLPYLYYAIVLIFGIAAGAMITYDRHFQNVNNIYYPLWNISTESMDPQYFGQWVGVVPDNISASFGQMLGMQTVHSLLLPNGKVLVASGSSWRNRKDKTEVYPYVAEPKPTVGLYNHSNFILNGTEEENKRKLYEYFKLNNNIGIYDPEKNTFFRIPHPAQTVYNGSFQPNDFFCTGHSHLSDGNPLFVGGTQLYFPWRSGHRATYIFNWTKQQQIDWTGLKDWGFQGSWDKVQQNKKSGKFYPWIDAGLMKTGRWYPSIIPLQSGQMVYMSGFIGQYDNHSMFRYEINKYVQIFDYKEFKENRKDNKTTKFYQFDCSKIQNSPFTTKLISPPPAANCSNNSTDSYPYSQQTRMRRCKSYQNDAFKLYPQDYLVENDKIYLTQQGDWNSLRQQKACCNRETKNTYYMKIQRNLQSKITNISFEKGPQRRQYVSMSGTSTKYRFTKNDPQKILLFGGMNMMLSGTYLPGLGSIDDQDYNDKIPHQEKLQYAGSRGSRKLQVFDINNQVWEQINKTYIGATYEYDRTMHYSIILPTKQILIVNGGNYDYFNPVYSPILLTPFFNQTAKKYSFNRTVMAPSRIGKLYHNIAVLLRDGRVLTSGGNAVRAIVDAQKDIVDKKIPTEGQYKYNPQQVNLALFFRTQSTIAAGFSNSPAQSQRMQIFQPPYMFIDGKRQVQVNLTGKYLPVQNVSKKEYYLMKSNLEYELTVSNNNMTEGCDKASIVLLKLASSTHGWDSGQRMYILQYQTSNHQFYRFKSPDAKQHLIVPGFYHLFYVDCKGKPSKSLMIRFDDSANSVLG